MARRFIQKTVGVLAVLASLAVGNPTGVQATATYKAIAETKITILSVDNVTVPGGSIAALDIKRAESVFSLNSRTLEEPDLPLPPGRLSHPKTTPL